MRRINPICLPGVVTDFLSLMDFLIFVRAVKLELGLWSGFEGGGLRCSRPGGGEGVRMEALRGIRKFGLFRVKL